MSDESILTDSSSSREDSKSMTGMKRANQVASVVLFLFALYMISDSLKMKLSDQYGPGPGLFPLGLGVILAILSISLFFENISPLKKDKASPFPGRKALFSVGLVVTALIGYALVINKLGYIITTFLFVLFVMGIIQRDKVITTALTATAVALLLYMVFEVGLGVRLPKGPFGF